MMHGEIEARHLTVEEVAACADRGLARAERARVEEHLAACAACRAEVIAVARLSRSLAGRRRWAVMAPLAAAAAALVLVLTPWQRHGPVGGPSPQPVLREPAVTATVAPTPLTPRGGVAALTALTWSSVPHADRYQVTLFDQDGSVLWETHTGDTSVVVPDTVRLVPGIPHYWKVAARTEQGRWVASDLTSFTVSRPRPRR
jgi:putative zinc finger protein